MDFNEVVREWAERSGAYSPDYYAYYGPNETSDLLLRRLEAVLEPDDAVLEIGCSSGRHLAHLHDNGFENLHGVEINEEAFDVMERTYPELADAGTFYRGTIESFVSEFEDDQFGAVYAVETLQHLHPDSEWVFAELARVASTLVVTVENENGDGEGDESGDGGETEDVNYVDDEFPLYYRDWNRVFTELGLEEVDSESAGKDTLRVFRADR